MKKASSRFMLFAFAAMFVSVQSFAQTRGPQQPNRPGQGQGGGQHGPQQPGPQQPQQPQYPQQPQQPQYPGSQFPTMQTEIIQEQANIVVHSYERLRLSDLLRLSRSQEMLEVVTLRIQAQSMAQGSASLQISSMGRQLSSQMVSRQMQEVILTLPAGQLIDSLELAASGDTYLSTITAEVRSQRYPQPGPGPGQVIQVAPNSLVTLQVNQMTRGYAEISLDQLVRQQLGATLEGAQIERVVVQGQGQMGRAASVQVELNNRPIGQVKYLTPGQTPLQVQSMEEVRSLSLLVNGDAQIQEIRIRVGQVRPRQPELPRTERVFVGRQIDVRMSLSLSELLRYESRLIKSIRIEGRSLRQVQALMTLSSYSGLEGNAVLGSNPSSALIVLRRPTAASELRIDAQAAILIDSVEIEFENFPRR